MNRAIIKQIRQIQKKFSGETDRQTDRQRQRQRQTERDKIILYYTRIKIYAHVGFFYNTQYVKQEYK